MSLRRWAVVLLAVMTACAPLSVTAKGGGHSGSHSSSANNSASHAGHASSGHTGDSRSGSAHGAKTKAPSDHAGTHTKSAGTGKHKSTYADSAQRDKRGRIARSEKAKADFKKQHPCPATGKSSGACPGYVIDHRQALKHGGKDEPSNMQWQTRAEAKAKDKIE
jgi:hypothetical protein